MFSPTNIENDEEAHNEETTDEGVKSNQTSVCDFFTNPVLFLNILIMMGVWSVSSGGYYLINFNMKYVGGSILSNIIASVSSEFTANIASLILLNAIGHKLTLIAFFLISGVSGFVFCTISLNSFTTALLILLSKFGISAAFCSVFITTSMVFPSRYVATAFGMCNVIGRTVSICLYLNKIFFY